MSSEITLNNHPRKSYGWDESAFLKTTDSLMSMICDDPYTAFLKGKIVSIVGPADYLLDRNYGKQIDQSDLVLRFNTAWNYLPFKRNMARAIGNRCDLLYLAPSDLHRIILEGEKKIIKKCRKLSLRYIVFQSIMHRRQTYVTDIVPNEWEKWNKLKSEYERIFRRNKVSTKILWGWHPGSVVSTILTDMTQHPVMARMGFFAIFDLLMRSVKQINVFGMTFYHGGGNMFRSDNIDILHPTKRHDGGISVHDSHAEFFLLEKMINIFPGKIFFDNVISPYFLEPSSMRSV